MEVTISLARQKMQKTIEHLLEELLSIRSGRAAPSLLESVKVAAYGQNMQLRELASVNAPEPRLLIVQPWDPSNTDPIAKAIRESGMSLNPIVEQNLIRVAVPPLNEERRGELIKLVGEKGEAAKVGIRSARREAIEEVDKAEKSSKISKDEAHRFGEEIQKLTDEMSGEVERVTTAKETELKEI